MAALAAVQAFGAKQRAARQAPVPSAGSETAIGEAVAALVELREMDAPEAKRGHMPEGDGDGGAQQGDGATVASDKAHMAWQLRRLLLFDRRVALPPFMETRKQAVRQAIGETSLCNAVCAAALVQGSVAGDGSNGEDATWELEVLNGLDGPNADGHALKHRRRQLALVISIGRGSEAPRPTPPRAQHPNSSPAEALPAPTVALADGSAPKYSKITELTTFLHGEGGGRCEQRLGMSRSSMVSFVERLPGSLTNHDAAAIKALCKALASRRNTAPPRVRDVYPTAPRALHDVVGVVSDVPLGDGKHVLLLQTLNGRPQYVSNGLYSSPELAFKSMCSELRDSKPLWLGRFGPGSVLLGPSIPTTGKSPWCVAVCPDNAWRSAIAGPANDMRSLVLGKAATKGLTISKTTEPRFRGLRGLFAIIGEFADVKYSHLLGN